jgi:hypothetical protein
MQPCVNCSTDWPRRAARLVRRSRLENPVGSRSKSSKAFQIACTMGSAKRRAELLEGLLGENAVVCDGLCFQEAAVGLEAHLPESGQVSQAFPDVEILGVVDGRLCT